MGLFGLMTTASWAAEQSWCVFDPLGTQGDISRRLQDVRAYALQNQVQLKFKVFKNEKDAIQSFEQKQCSGLVASNFNTHRYNNFMATTGGIGLIPNNRVVRAFLQLLNHPNVEKRMALALPFFKIERFAIVMPTFSESSVTLIFRFASITSMLMIIAIVFTSNR